MVTFTPQALRRSFHYPFNWILCELHGRSGWFEGETILLTLPEFEPSILSRLARNTVSMVIGVTRTKRKILSK